MQSKKQKEINALHNKKEAKRKLDLFNQKTFYEGMPARNKIQHEQHQVHLKNLKAWRDFKKQAEQDAKVKDKQIAVGE